MKSRKKNADAPPSANGPSFEQAIQRLEQIVADMEVAEKEVAASDLAQRRGAKAGGKKK